MKLRFGFLKARKNGGWETFRNHVKVSINIILESLVLFITGNRTKVSFKDWGDKMQAHFENLFWINSTPIPEHEPHPELINRRGMYKDCYLSLPFWSDFQLRPNFAVAMVVVRFTLCYFPTLDWTLKIVNSFF